MSIVDVPVYNIELSDPAIIMVQKVRKGLPRDKLIKRKSTKLVNYTGPTG